MAVPATEHTSPTAAPVVRPGRAGVRWLGARGQGGGRRRDLLRRPLSTWLGVGLPVLLTAVVGVVYRAALTKPLYFDEQWRAYQISARPGIWADLRHAMAPLPLGWLAIERLSVEVLGNTHGALRAPDLPAIALLGIGCYLLGRRWLPQRVAVATGALTVVLAPVLAYGLMLKPYGWDAAATAFTFEFWLAAREDGASARRQVGCYAGIAVCAVIATPMVFLLPWLLLWDGVAFLHQPRDVHARLRLLGAAGVVAVVAAHSLGFLLRQGITEDDVNYFRADYVPLTGARAAMSFVWHGLAHFPTLVSTAGWLPSDAVWPWVPKPLTRPPTWGLPLLARAGATVGLTAGLLRAVMVRSRRPMALAVVGALGLLLVASAVRAWPFGALRVNFFLFPLVLLLTVTGLTDLVRLVRPTWLRLTAGLLAATVATTVLLAQAQRDVQMVAQTRWVMGGALVADAAGQIRATAGPHDVVLLATRAKAPPKVYMHGWYYYLQTFEGYPKAVQDRRTVPDDQIFALTGLPIGPARAFVAVHRSAEHVFLFQSWWSAPSAQFADALGADGFCPSEARVLYFTGRLDIFTRASCRRP